MSLRAQINPGAMLGHFNYRQSDREIALDFGLVIWLLASISVVFVFSASGYFPPLFLLALMVCGVMLMLVLLSGKSALALALTVVFVIGFNASYLPLFGIISGIMGEPSLIFRYALGARSAWFALALVFVVCMAMRESKLLRGELIVPIVLACMVIIASFAVSPAPLDSRITYLLNSFLPLFFTIAAIAAIHHIAPLAFTDAKRLADIVVVGMILGAVYFFLLPVTFDYFRPDLASFLRARPGEGIPVGGYDPSWGTRIFGYVTNRFVGTFPDAIICGYFLAATSFAMFVSGFRGYAAFLFFLLVISLSKGAWLLFFQAIVLFYVLKKSTRMALVTAIGFVMLQLFLATVLEASNRMHYLGLVGGVASTVQGGVSAFFIGYGIGEGGNLARGYVAGGAFGAGWLGSGSESGVGVLVHQIGTVGALCLAFLVFRVFSTLGAREIGKAAARKERSIHTILATRALLLSLLVNTPLQENCINASILSSILLSILLIRGLDERSSAATAPSKYGLRAANVDSVTARI